MNIDEQLENFLADLGVEMERSKHEQFDENSIPEVSIFQASRDHYGVFFRLDIIKQEPQLRIMVPVESGALKMEMYIVRMSERSPVNPWFSALAAYRGGPAFERGPARLDLLRMPGLRAMLVVENGQGVIHDRQSGSGWPGSN